MERVLGAAGTLLLVAIGLAVAARALRRHRRLRLDGGRVGRGASRSSACCSSRGGRGACSRSASSRSGGGSASSGWCRACTRLCTATGTSHARSRSSSQSRSLPQLVRIMAIWLCGKAVGETPSPLAYIVVGPLLFLVMLIPFTINGLGAREAFFLAFLPRFGVSNDAAVRNRLSLLRRHGGRAIPGGIILLWRSVRSGRDSVTAASPPDIGWRHPRTFMSATRVLVTGGAGFIGSHLSDRLLAEGHEVRALDSLEPQVHPGGERPDYLDSGVELLSGRRSRPGRGAREALDGRRRRRPPGRRCRRRPVDVRDRALHVRSTRSAAPSCSRRSSSAATRSRRLVVASSMSIYGEGQYVDRRPASTASRRAFAPEEQLDRREWEVRGAERAPLEPEPTAEAKPLRPTSIYAITKRDHEELVLVDRRRLRDPDGRAALLQRLRRAPGAVEPVHGRGGDLRVAAPERAAAARLRGRAADPRLHPRPRHRSRPARSR